VILVNTLFAEYDYAIMKQIQQIKLINPADPTLSVVSLEHQPDLSRLGLTEKLYVVSHGLAGDFFLGYVDKGGLLGYLTDAQHGVPHGFHGDIIVLSCYGGTAPYNGSSLVTYLANALQGRAAANTVVTGAIGYSFGTPEFRHSGRSSVLRDSAFYTFGNINGMVDKWLTLNPTHAGGVLQDDLNINVAMNKTIGDLLAMVQQSKGVPKEVAAKYMDSFAINAKQIEDTLKDRLTQIPGSTVAQRADYLVTQSTKQIVIDWNNAIAQQYKLYSDLYLWAPTANAFTTANVA
jgi:hypothetical protein